MSLFSQFRANRDERPDMPAFLIAAGDRSVPITWREFAHDIEVIAWLAKKFVPGATVGLLGENSYEWITAHAAGLFAGITVVPIETNLSPPEIAERLRGAPAHPLGPLRRKGARGREARPRARHRRFRIPQGR